MEPNELLQDWLETTHYTGPDGIDTGEWDIPETEIDPEDDEDDDDE